MKKSFICLFLTLALLLGCLCGCDLSSLRDFLPHSSESTEPTPRPTYAPPFESYYALITRDDLVLWREADPTSEILGTVSSGDTVQVLRIVSIDGVSWASTDRGWIYAEHVQMPAQTPQQTPVNDGTNAVVIAGTSDIHVTSDPASSTRGMLESGDRVTISQFTHYANTAMVYVGNGWVKLYDLLFDGCSRSGVLPCIVTYDGMNVRSGPSTNYASVGKASAGTEILVRSVFNSDMQGKPWAVTNENRWYFLEYLQLPEGIVYVAGDNANYPFPPKDGEVSAPGTSNNSSGTHSPSQGIQQVPNNTFIVGAWTQYDPDSFLKKGSLYNKGIVFYSDGSFQTDEGGGYDAYLCDSGTFVGAKGGAGEGGIFTYDGNTLTLQFDYLWYAGEYEPYSNPRTESYKTAIGVNYEYLDFGGTSYRNSSNWKENELLYLIMAGSTGPYVKSGYVGTWQAQNGSMLTLKSDGTFTESEGGNTYTGDYLVINDHLYLSRTTKNGSAHRFFVYGKINNTGSSMTYSIYNWFEIAITKEYTKVSG